MSIRNHNIESVRAARPSFRQRLAQDHPHLYFTAPFAAWALFILAASLAPPSQLPHFEFDLADKIEHGVSYALLGALALRAWLGLQRPPRLSAVFWTIGAAFCWGMLLETGQAMTGYRTFDWLDGLCNLAGAFAGAWAWFFIARAHDAGRLAGFAPSGPAPEPALGAVSPCRDDRTMAENGKEQKS